MLLHCLASDILRFEEKNERKKKSETFVKKQWFCSSLAEDNFDLTEKKKIIFSRKIVKMILHLYFDNFNVPLKL